MSDDDSSLGDIETPPPKQKLRSKKKKSTRSTSENHVPERPQSGPPQSNPDELAEGLSRWIEASTSFFYVEIFSLVLVFSCWAHWVDWSYMKYALSVGAVSLGICVILQTMEFIFPGWLNKEIVKERSDGRGGHTVEKIASVFLLVWWSLGTGIITFHGEVFNVDTYCGNKQMHIHDQIKLLSHPHCKKTRPVCSYFKWLVCR